MNVEAIEAAGSSHIAQPLQRRPHQGCATVALVDKQEDLCPGDPIAGDAGLQLRELTGDGLGLCLLLGGDTGIEALWQSRRELVQLVHCARLSPASARACSG